MLLIREHASLTDAWEQSRESLPRPPSITSIHDIPSPQQALREYGVTADSPLNSYSASKPLDSVARRQISHTLTDLFHHANAFAEAGHEVQIFLLGEAVSLMRAVVAGSVVPVGWAPLSDALAKVIDHRVPIHV